MKKTVLLTGASGFIGTQIARYLLEDPQATIIALIRAGDREEGKRKLARNWWDWPELIQALDSQVDVLCGDLSLSRFGLTEAEYASLAEKTTHIIHTAADWRLVPLEEIRKTNVHGTANVLEFAEKAQFHQLERLSHISTAYVAGGRTGVVSENDLTDKFGFFSTYEQSKYEGELLVQAKKKTLPISVFRPSMVVGDSQTGAAKTFNTVYFPLRLYLTGKLRFLPLKRSFKINVVPVDYVAKAVVKLTFEPKAEGLNFHVVTPYEQLPTLEEMMVSVQKWAKGHLNVKLPSPICVSMSPSTMKRLLKLQRTLKLGSRRAIDSLIGLAPYFGENRRLLRENTDKLLGAYDLKWQEYLPHLLEYATYNSFFHRSDRTVYEQALFRLESRSHPMTYFDIVEGEVTARSAEEMCRDILAVAGALRNSGVGVGDRVALTGLNCTKYLATDIAIGLLGAVTVPIYYTSPPADTDQILKASGAKLFFVGIPSLLQRITELESNIPIVSFCRSTIPQGIGKKVVAWKDFISHIPKTAVPQTSSVGFGDIATLRYSSGTTGKPKGAIFKHENLRYMAESVVSTMPWRARNHGGSYLSFLPMGHVVEGILATYSPYYFPGPVSIYFLEDFKQLQKALPKVRPTIFFAVPRLYEKVWEGLEKNALGRLYISRKNGFVKRLLARMLRGAVMKRAGLDKCAQLISGSAGFDEKLLWDFHELGIEVHDAYGLTEAPLVALNRLGKNRIGTVGQPMPMTQIKIAEDGEIMVKGPQVAVGYFDKSLESPIRDGWLMTGDIGRLTDEGSLEIFGRKKELIKTSYGKAICPGKIEEMLREIAGVSEAMLVGESKPYCAALIWVPKDKSDEATFKRIDQAVEQMNKRLSNPEKVKRWALLANTLSIENGDLTPNLKLKRNMLTQRCTQVVDALYCGVVPENVLHIGGAEKAE